MRKSRGRTSSSTTGALSGWRSMFGGGRSLAYEEERENVDNEADDEDEASSPADRYYDFRNDIKAVARFRKLTGSSKGYTSTDDYYYSGGTYQDEPTRSAIQLHCMPLINAPFFQSAFVREGKGQRKRQGQSWRLLPLFFQQRYVSLRKT